MSLPPLNPADASLLTRYLLAHENLHTLLSQPDAPELLALLNFLAHPGITPWLDHYRAIMAHAHQHAALSALSEVLRDTTDPIQRRLAATALLQSRTPRPPRAESHAPNPSTPRAPQNTPRQSSTPSTLDASMPSCLDASPPLTHPASPTTADRAFDTRDRTDDSRSASPDPDPENDLDIALDQSIDDEINRDDEERDELDDDDSPSDDPLLTAALTGDPAAIHRLFVERTGHPPDPTLAANLSRALQPTPIPTD